MRPREKKTSSTSQGGGRGEKPVHLHICTSGCPATSFCAIPHRASGAIPLCRSGGFSSSPPATRGEGGYSASGVPYFLQVFVCGIWVYGNKGVKVD